MQQIPAKEGFEEIGEIWLKNNPGKKMSDFYLRYRNAFFYLKGWDFVDSDYTGQELALIAESSQDEVWFEAIKEGKDLHSVTASMVFGKAWEKETLSTCAFAANHQKCKCPGHKTMRNKIKTVNFGLAYGMSKYKLSSTLRIPLPEAQQLIDRYFATFPQIGKTLTAFGAFAVCNGYTLTLAPFNRRREFPEWIHVKHKVDFFRRGIERVYALEAIERQGKNTPIQGSGADLMKLAMWYTFKEIHLVQKIPHLVHILLNVHDQLTTACHSSMTEYWKVRLDELMCEAALVIVKSGILKADTQVSECWTK